MDSLVDEYVTANLPGATVRMQYLVERIRRNLVNLLGFIQRDPAPVGLSAGGL